MSDLLGDTNTGEFTQLLLNSGVNPLNENFTLNFIPQGMFYNCTYDKELEIPNSVKHIRTGAFQKSNIGNIKFNSNIEKIGMEAFVGSQIKELNLKDSNIRYISVNSFISSALESINLSGCNDITIDVCAFNQCLNLKSIVLPSVFSIRKFAFGGCVNLQHIKYEGNVKDFYANCIIHKGNFLDSKNVEYIECRDRDISIGNLFNE